MSLSRDCDFLWQQPKFRLFPSDPKVRIYNGPICLGINPIETFVSTVVRANGLQEEKYTNHCLHVMGINILMTGAKTPSIFHYD